MSSPARSRRRKLLRNAARCPDCNSDVRAAAAADNGGVRRAEVLHDPTCPWWRARGAAPFRQVRILDLTHGGEA